MRHERAAISVGASMPWLPCFAILLSPVGAQTAPNAPLDVWLWQRLGSAAVANVPDTTARGETSSAGTIPVDLMRRPLPAKARQMLLKALRAIQTGDHPGAIRLLEETLAKYPDSAAWTQSLLGTEYLKADQFAAAVNSFELAVELLPNDAVNRYNLGLSFVSVGQYDRAERELRRALELDHGHVKARQLLNALLDRRIAGRD